MIREHLRAAAPVLYPGAVAAVCAFIGGRFTPDASIAAGALMAGALAGLIYCGALAYELRQQKRLWDRALRTSIVVIGRDGKCLSGTVLDLLEQDRPRGGEMISFEDPYLVRITAWGDDARPKRSAGQAPDGTLQPEGNP